MAEYSGTMSPYVLVRLQLSRYRSDLRKSVLNILACVQITLYVWLENIFMCAAKSYYIIYSDIAYTRLCTMDSL